jgi:hypothetical protein
MSLPKKCIVPPLLERIRLNPRSDVYSVWLMYLFYIPILCASIPCNIGFSTNHVRFAPSAFRSHGQRVGKLLN